MSQIEKKQGKPTCKSILSKKPNMKKQKTKLSQNSGQTCFFQHNLNSDCKHDADNKLQVYYWECHLLCLKSFHRLSMHSKTILIPRYSQFTHP